MGEVGFGREGWVIVYGREGVGGRWFWGCLCLWLVFGGRFVLGNLIWRVGVKL